MAKSKKAKNKIDAFDELSQSLNDALAFESGSAIDLRTSEMPKPPKKMKPAEIRHVRESLNASQVVFANFLCVSPKAVQAWEQGTRRPQSSALRLLDIVKKNPSVLLAK